MEDESSIDVDMLLASAKQGDSEAQFVLAEQFRSRAALDIDDEQAFLWYRHAAASGHAEAQFRLARSYTRGKGTVADHEVALT